MADKAGFGALAPFFWPGWHRGQLLALSGLDGQTDYEGGLVLRTETAPAAIRVVYPAEAWLTLAGTVTEACVSCDLVLARMEGGGLLRGAMLDAHHLLLEGPVALAAAPGLDERLAVRMAGERLLIGAAPHFQPALIEADLDAALAARAGWLLGQPLAHRFTGVRRHAVFRALSIMKGQVSAPEAAIPLRWTTPDRWPHKDMWLWDSMFHAIGWRHLDPRLAQEMIEAVFAGQKPDGFVPHQMSPTRRPSEITQPPVLAFGVAMVEAASPDPAWIARLYPKLAAYILWDLTHRDGEGDGLCEWFMEGDPHSRSGESGMDNSPRFDFHYPTPLAATDFNAFLARECQILCDFAERLGMASDANLWRARADRLARLIERHLWSEEAGLYCDYDVEAGERSPVLASAGFLPLFARVPGLDRARRMARLLDEPGFFATAVPVPSIAVADTAHYAKDMWRGPAWINVNWLIAQGLARYGAEDASLAERAAALDAASLAVIEAACARHSTFFEYYDDRGEAEPPALLRKGECNPANPFRQVIHDYGWTATLYLDLVARMGEEG
ncbi:amylo-alpha-1,6-glucosidase [Acidisoma sp. C75]